MVAISKKYNFLMLLALLLPQIHYLPQILKREELNPLLMIFWIMVIFVSLLLSGVILLVLIKHHSSYYSKSTQMMVYTFMVSFGALFLLYFLTVNFEDSLLFIAYFLPYLGPLFLYGSLIVYYSMVYFIMRDIKGMTKTKELTLFEKVALIAPIVTFIISAPNGYFILALGGTPINTSQTLTLDSFLNIVSILLMVLSLIQPITIIKIIKDWISN